MVFFIIIVTARVISSKQQTIQTDSTIVFTINKGSSFSSVCHTMVEAGLITDCFGHKLENKLFSTNLNIKSGTYQIEPNMTFEQVVRRFIRAEEHQFSFTILEGDNIYQVLEKIKGSPYLRDDVSQLTLPQLASNLGLTGSHPEGYLHPDTYFYTDGTRATKLLTRAAVKQQDVLAKLWQTKSDKTILDSPYEALILASIIEKESAIMAERDVIASVFYNRLRKNMRLQTDPTVIYGVWDEYKGDITRRHLKLKTAYNTYRINGLPPTPIANPSADSIKAALHPATTEYFYFVASGNGAHKFSKTLEEHNLAVKQYLKNTRS